MAKEFAIVPGDHGAGIAQEGHDGVANRRVLPLVSCDAANAEDDLRDFQLGSAVARTVNGLQHTARSRPLLTGQACVRRNGPVMECGEETADPLKAIKAGNAERHNGGERNVTRSCVNA